MDRLRVLPIVLLPLVAVACGDAPTTPDSGEPLAPAGATVFWFPFASPDFPSPCIGETVNAVGEGQVVVQEFLNDDGYHLSGLISIRGTAVGNVSGIVYQAKFNSTFVTQVADDGAAVLFSDVLRFRLISKGPAANQIDMAHLHVTLNADGTITALIDQPRDTVCVG